MHRSGFVNLIGHPNVGKSTLANALLGERLSIISPKAQTTRHRIFGILNGVLPESMALEAAASSEQALAAGTPFQLVFSDTPGVLKPQYALQETMLEAVQGVFEDADVLLYVVELGEGPLRDERLYRKIADSDVPLVVVLNKIDLHDQARLETEVALWQERLPRAEIIPISALKGFQTEYLLGRLVALVPESPPYFEGDALTDRSERFVTSEMIREQVLHHYDKEIPYAVEVGIDSFVEEENLIRIRALLYVARDSQKGILIGHKGAMLKKVGTGARLQMESFFGKKVYLELFVKVAADWRNDRKQLKRFGYE
jgi:GTP-binding protein Era